MRSACGLGALLLLVAVAPACSSSGNGGKFCDLLAGSTADSDFTTPAGAAAGAQRFRDLVEQAPEEIRDDVENVQDAVRDMAAAKTPEEIEAARNRLGRSDTQTAILNLANYRASYC